MPGRYKGFKNAYERIHQFSLSKDYYIQKDAVKEQGRSKAKGMKKNHKKGTTYSKTGSGFHKSKVVVPYETHASNVIYGYSEVNNRKHPAVFPYWLPEWFIRAFTKKNDTVLDPFVGSGTTLLAAYEIGRRSIGMEISKEYHNNTKRTLEKRLSGVPLKDILNPSKIVLGDVDNITTLI